MTCKHFSYKALKQLSDNTAPAGSICRWQIKLCSATYRKVWGSASETVLLIYPYLELLAYTKFKQMNRIVIGT